MSSVSRSPIPPAIDSDETQPLLGAVNIEEDNLEDGTEDVEAKPQNVSLGAKLLYALLAITGAALLVLMVKGFLDSDDVEVCFFGCFRIRLRDST